MISANGRLRSSSVDRPRYRDQAGLIEVSVPSNVATPQFLAGRAEEIAGEHEALSFEALGRDEIVERGMGAFDASLSFGDSLNAEGARMPEPNADYGTATQELARALALRDPKIAALVGTDGRTPPSCAALKAAL